MNPSMPANTNGTSHAGATAYVTSAVETNPQAKEEFTVNDTTTTPENEASALSYSRPTFYSEPQPVIDLDGFSVIADSAEDCEGREVVTLGLVVGPVKIDVNLTPEQSLALAEQLADSALVHLNHVDAERVEAAAESVGTGPSAPTRPAIEKSPEQENVLDGTIYVMQVHPDAGAYITIAGRGEDIKIIAFDLEDMATLAGVAKELGVTA
ncbi:hypothetical protein R3Q06_18080 [Rhodococcus erythropolis]|uniref:hypothetical protein n=1 Tax=Rhodococcus erythropolis TaxID=1833 RepID=UPI002949D01A|nr:hypothetical protein [Rhodococcus erythropolis]MDV6275407.1 hypothetical protein [Rhodococcus erythropolis]